MKRLNNKGYMIVEIIVSATIAMTIAYFMMDLIVKLKEKYDYVQNDTILMTDKTVITNEILGDLYKREIKCAKKDNNSIIYELKDGATWLGLSYDSSNKLIKYQKSDNSIIEETDEIIYQKKLNDNLQIKNTDIEIYDIEGETDKKIASFIINAETLTSKKNYGVNIIIPVNGVCS